MKKIILFFVVNLFVMNGLFAQDNFMPVQKSAKFPGGDKEFIKFLETNLRYPSKPKREGKEGTVYVKFIVDKDGSIIKDCVSVSRSVDIDLDAEAVRLVRMFPNWTPALQNERPIRQRLRVPVKFKIAK